jgi:potassium efflux system protein
MNPFSYVFPRRSGNRKQEGANIYRSEMIFFSRILLILFGIFYILVDHYPLLAQEPLTQDTVKQKILTIPVPEITRQATQVSSILLEKRKILLTGENKAMIVTRTDTLIFRLNLLREDPRVPKIKTLSLRSLTDLEDEWHLLNSRLENEQVILTSQVRDLENEKDLLEEMFSLWQQTMISTQQIGAPEMVIQQISSTIEGIQQLQSSLQSDSEFLQEKLVQVSTGLIFCNEILVKVRSAREFATKNLLNLNQSPIWKVFGPQKDTLIIEAKRSLIEDTVSGLKDFGMNYSFKLWLHLILFIVILVFVKYSFRNLKNYIPEEDIPQAAIIKKIIQRPVSSAFLISFLLTYILYETIPDSVNLVNTVFLLVPVLFILSDIITGTTRRFIYLPVVAAVLVQIHSMGYSETFFNRIFLMLIILFCLLSIGLIVESKTLRKLIISIRLGRIMYGLSFVYLILLSIAFLAVIAGAVMLAEFITYATIKSAALMLILYALSLTVNSIIITSLNSKSLQKLNFIRHYHEILDKRLVNIVNLVSWILWLILTLSLFTIWDDIYQGGKRFFTHSISIGTVDVSLWNILVFFFIIWLTLWISRMAKIIIEGELAPRVTLKRGVPGAISLILRITIITVGFLFAIAAAGVEMNKLAILLGALGVGIGFGLQNIFNNLVSGIILAFERPIQEGDIIEVGELWGTVKEIGIRASTVFTFDGAEVIVPNGNLISKELINWTLTNQQRRVEVTVGVKYGTDTEKVLAILRKVAAEHKEILKEPAPLALFTGFGESSLDFRLLFWIPKADNRFIIHSELNVAVNNALKEAGIEIPFPQHDLHVRSVDSSLLKNLPGKKK